MTVGYFITGTDTGVGKTIVSLALMQTLQQRGSTVNAMKPVASGCVRTQRGLRNDDAVRLQQQCSTSFDYHTINPFAFVPPIAPHIAATEVKSAIDVAVIQDCYNNIAAHSDIVIVEGAGGLLVPLNTTHSMLDIAKLLQLQVIVVVGVRLGCINHALLTFQVLEQARIDTAGWIANQLDQHTTHRDEIIDTISQRTHSPLLGTLNFQQDISFSNIAMQLSI